MSNMQSNETFDTNQHDVRTPVSFGSINKANKLHSRNDHANIGIAELKKNYYSQASIASKR